ncbi:MAG: hypothetical protein HFH74_13255 [Lachnospiraceae bacterium]|jgi:hypothetical protein|nr:hypothetical protein [Lachnospiraceae bacterium]
MIEVQKGAWYNWDRKNSERLRVYIMIKLYDWDRIATSKNEALVKASDYTGFSKEDFKCEVIKEPKKVGLFKKEDGIYHCWYEYNGMDADIDFLIADAHLYLDFNQKKILVIRIGFKAHELDCSDLVDYEMVVNSNNKTYTISNQNKALKGAVLFGATGAIVGAANSEIISKTTEFAELVIRLRFRGKEPFEILTSKTSYDTTSKLWRDILDQSKKADEYLKKLIND